MEDGDMHGVCREYMLSTDDSSMLRSWEGVIKDTIQSIEAEQRESELQGLIASLVNKDQTYNDADKMFLERRYATLEWTDQNPTMWGWLMVRKQEDPNKRSWRLTHWKRRFVELHEHHLVVRLSPKEDSNGQDSIIIALDVGSVGVSPVTEDAQYDSFQLKTEFHTRGGQGSWRTHNFTFGFKTKQDSEAMQWQTALSKVAVGERYKASAVIAGKRMQYEVDTKKKKMSVTSSMRLVNGRRPSRPNFNVESMPEGREEDGIGEYRGGGRTTRTSQVGWRTLSSPDLSGLLPKARVSGGSKHSARSGG
jgi:hypothetical protein